MNHLVHYRPSLSRSASQRGSTSCTACASWSCYHFVSIARTGLLMCCTHANLLPLTSVNFFVAGLRMSSLGLT